MIREEMALSFDDVLLVPKYFSGNSRKDIDLTTNIAGLELKLPIISANMPNVTGYEMCKVLSDAGGIGILDRITRKWPSNIATFKKENPDVRLGVSIGIDNNCLDDAADYINHGADIICIDVAHGHQKRVLEVVESFKKKWPKFPLIVGNFATPPLFRQMRYENIAFKCGIGGGSVCTTRIKTGCGVPTFESVYCCADGARHIIADGGIKSSGDIVKSLAAGANAVMIGSLLAGTDQAPGAIIQDKHGNKFKAYRGNASAGAKEAAGLSSEFIEGAETLVPYKGSAVKILKELEDGIRSGFSYCGSMNLEELRSRAEFIKISPAGYRESLPHGTL